MIITIAYLALNLSTLSSTPLIHTPTDREMAMIDEINYVRTNPKDYIQFIDDYTTYWESDASELRTAKELKGVLNRMEPVDSIYFSQDIYEMCFKHGEWMKRTGRFDHSSYDIAENLVSGEETVRMALLSLLIDDGIPSRGHRTNILEAEYTKVACSEVLGTVGDDTYVFVQGFDF